MSAQTPLLNVLTTFNTSNVPRRRFRLVLDLGADDRSDLADSLARLVEWLYDNDDFPKVCTSGGVDAGYHVEVVDYGADITHDTYVAALDAFLAPEDVRAVVATVPYSEHLRDANGTDEDVA